MESSAAFAVTHGMFPASTTLSSTFTPKSTSLCAPKASRAARVNMVVDPFQRRFQTPGRIYIDYSRPKKLVSYKRSGYSAMIGYPMAPAFAGVYSLSNCGLMGGSAKIIMKADEFMAKNVMRQYKELSVPYGEYSTKCTEGITKLQADEKRVFSRTSAFKQSQKPVNIRIREAYDARKKAFIAANLCSAEEAKFKMFPMAARVYNATRNEALGTCTRYVQPQSVAEEYMKNSVMNQVRQAQCPYGEYAVGACNEGFVKGQAEERRSACLAAEYRAAQQDAAATTRQRYDAPKAAVMYYGHECSHEEQQYYGMPAVAAAMMRD